MIGQQPWRANTQQASACSRVQSSPSHRAVATGAWGGEGVGAAPASSEHGAGKHGEVGYACVQREQGAACCALCRIRGAWRVPLATWHVESNDYGEAITNDYERLRTGGAALRGDLIGERAEQAHKLLSPHHEHAGRLGRRNRRSALLRREQRKLAEEVTPL